ncbi:MAG: class I SAM-dependent methyltransferase [Candidatus Kariarchaeaceae archaeon]|jgi:2-polyprenyl-3-methyl-5-hydroxy-6-metoxy-1,4-benzoquinol methylase
MEHDISVEEHFSIIANTYQELRTTDTKPIDYIIENLPSLENLQIIDLGCGTGRYDLLLLNELDDSGILTGVDANEEMLAKFVENLETQGYSNIRSICASITEIGNIETKQYDVVLSFNSLHHFNLGKFLKLIHQLLKPKGSAFLYTRTRTQNQRSIWGKYFPKFDYYESRLKSLTEMEKAIYDTEGIELKEMKIFNYHRYDKLEKLVKQVSNRHYSTFSIYNQEELVNAIRDFEKNIENEFNNIDEVDWIDRNVMLRIVKSKIEITE